jgi:hypothetical protein
VSVVAIVVVVVSVVVIVVVVVVIVLVDLKARDAVVKGNDRLLFVRKRVSIVECLVNTSSGVRRTSGIIEGGQEDALSVPLRAHGANIVLFVHVHTVVIVVVVIVVVVVTVVVVVVVSVGTLHGCALHESIEVLLFLSLVFDTFGHSRGLETSVFASIVVVGIFTVAIFTNHLARIFFLFFLHLGVTFDEFLHVNNILGNSVATSTAAIRVSGADDELDQVLGVDNTLFIVRVSIFSHLNEGRARVVLDGVTRKPVSFAAVLVVVVVVFKTTSLGQKSLSSLRGGRNVEVRNHAISSGDGSEEGQDGGSEQHGDDNGYYS